MSGQIVSEAAGFYNSLYSASVAAAGTVTGGTVEAPANIKNAVIQTVLTYGSGGTNCTAYVQTSLDQNTNWVDIASLQFTTATASKVVSLATTGSTTVVTPTDGSLSANTAVNGILGDRFRVKVVTTGTYATTTLAVTAVTKG